jgi:light-regulated signal transduction histidine kinase (bacteriophytochrome)
MVRFKLPLAALPATAQLVNKPESFYEKHRTLVWTTIGVISSLVIIILLLVANITQRRQAELAIARKAEELERTNRELQEFNVLAYHDMQEPLRTIGSFVQLLEKKYRDRLDGEALQYITYVVQGVTRMKQLFRDFLEYANLGKTAAVPGMVDMNRVLATVRARLHDAIASSGAVINAGSLPQVSGDEEKLTLLMHHLLDNAIKFRREVPLVIAIAAEASAGGQRFSVTDNGIGIDADYYQRIFDIFERLNPQDKYPGTGIGLALCRRIVEIHGGNIWVESVPGEKTTVYFTLA